MRPSLDETQIFALNNENDRFVVACPGSGKTRVALGKILEASHKACKRGSSILAITFAVNAKEELEKRVAAYAGSSLRRSISLNTIHGFVLAEVIGPHGALYGQQRLRLAQAGGVAYENALRATARDFAVDPDGLADLLKYVRRVSDGTAWQTSGQIVGIEASQVQAFWTALLEAGYVDYANALFVALKILEDHRWIREGLSATYETIVVDEYQDCTDIQLSLLRQLKRGGSTLFLVGDLFQCVYGFLGADINALSEFVNDIDADTVSLTGSYRCPSNVVEIAERIFERGVYSLGDAQTIEGHTRIITTGSEIDALLNLIDRCDREGIARSNIAFICAWHSRIAEIVAALRTKGVAAAVGQRRHPMCQDDLEPGPIEIFT